MYTLVYKRVEWDQKMMKLQDPRQAWNVIGNSQELKSPHIVEGLTGSGRLEINHIKKRCHAMQMYIALPNP